MGWGCGARIYNIVLQVLTLKLSLPKDQQQVVKQGGCSARLFIGQKLLCIPIQLAVVETMQQQHNFPTVIVNWKKACIFSFKQNTLVTICLNNFLVFVYIWERDKLSCSKEAPKYT